MKQKAEIVPASEQDLAVLAELAEQCFPDPWSENVFRRPCAAATTASGAAKVDGKLCGYAAVSRTGDAVNLDDIAVSPAFRGRASEDSCWTGRTGSSRKANSGWKCGSPTPPPLPCMNPQAIGRWAFGSGIITIQRKVLC